MLPHGKTLDSNPDSYVCSKPLLGMGKEECLMGLKHAQGNTEQRQVLPLPHEIWFKRLRPANRRMVNEVQLSIVSSSLSQSSCS